MAKIYIYIIYSREGKRVGHTRRQNLEIEPTIWGSEYHVGYLTFHRSKEGADKHLILLYMWITRVRHCTRPPGPSSSGSPCPP